jgi:hypothetical protein
MPKDNATAKSLPITRRATGVGHFRVWQRNAAPLARAFPCQIGQQTRSSRNAQVRRVMRGQTHPWPFRHCPPVGKDEFTSAHWPVKGKSVGNVPMNALVLPYLALIKAEKGRRSRVTVSKSAATKVTIPPPGSGVNDINQLVDFG